MKLTSKARLALFVTVAAAVLVGAGASGVFANPLPSISGDGTGEDTPYLPAGVPILHVHVNPHTFGYIRNTTPIEYRIDCPMACRRTYQPGTSITLQVYPQPGWTADGWTVVDPPTGLQCQGQSPSVCSFTMPGPTTGLPATGEVEIVAILKKA